MEFKLHYWVSNGGDGSANVRFVGSEEEAEKADAAQSEGWGESSAGYHRLKVEDGKVFFQSVEYDEKAKKYVSLWRPCEPVKAKKTKA